MDWVSLKQKLAGSKDAAATRQGRLHALNAVLKGKQYEVIKNDFTVESSGSTGDYVPLRERRPSVMTNMCRLIVDDTASLLFGERHFPVVIAGDDEEAASLLRSFGCQCELESIMIDALICGSIGSVAVRFDVKDNVPYLTVMNSEYLTPEFDEVTGELLSVAEQYYTKGSELRKRGFRIQDDELEVEWIWRRLWTKTEIIIYYPVKKNDPDTKDQPPVKDPQRSIVTGFDFVPIVWIRNLGHHKTEPEGESTFERGISTVIEMDYTLSQVGRAIRYTSDPIIVLRAGDEPPTTPEGQTSGHVGGSATVLNVPTGGDAKMLEINGHAASAGGQYVKDLKMIVLDQIHGNKMDGEHFREMRSGRGVERMAQPLVWLCDRLRQNYGKAINDIYQMAILFSQKLKDGLEINGKKVKINQVSKLELRWPAWFEPTDQELLALAQALGTATAAGILSRQTAAELYGTRAGLADPAKEWDRVEKDQKAREDLEQKFAGPHPQSLIKQ